MKFNLKRQKISRELIEFALYKAKKRKEIIPRATDKNLKTLKEALQAMDKNAVPPRFILKKLGKKQDKNLGRGIFLSPHAKPIERGETIAPYSGIVFLAPQNADDSSDYAFALFSDLKLTKLEQKKWDPKRRFNPKRLYSIDLDAAREGNFTRFINHSEEPNVEARLVRIPKNTLGIESAPFELLYIAKKKILPGQQLLVCYEGEDKSYWGALNIKPFAMSPHTFLLKRKIRIDTR